MTWRVVLKPTDEAVKLLVRDERGDLLRARLPAYPHSPYVLPRLLETLAMWDEQELLAVISADRNHRHHHLVALLGGPGLPGSDRVRYRLETPRPRPRRLRGPGDFRELYALHARWEKP